MNLIKIYLDSKPYGEKLSLLNVFMLYACTISHLFCQLMPHTTRAKILFSTERREKKSHDVMKNRNNLTRNKRIFIFI